MFSGYLSIVQMSEGQFRKRKLFHFMISIHINFHSTKDYLITSTYMNNMNSTALLDLRNMTWSITAEPPLKMRNPVITAKGNKEYCYSEL